MRQGGSGDCARTDATMRRVVALACDLCSRPLVPRTVRFPYNGNVFTLHAGVCVCSLGALLCVRRTNPHNCVGDHGVGDRCPFHVPSVPHNVFTAARVGRRTPSSNNFFALG
eukprot:5736843-Prymnesium_polylepis.1